MSYSEDAVCIPAKCGKNGRDFYMIYYKAYDEKWSLTYGKAEKPSQSGGTGLTVSIRMDSIRTGPQYKCPHCGDKYTFICWSCGKRTCYDGNNYEGREVTCAHCGSVGVFKSSGNNRKKQNNDIIAMSVSGQ